MLEVLGATDLIAADRDDYLRIAVRLGTDAEWRTEQRRRIEGGRGRLFDDRANRTGSIVAFVVSLLLRLRSVEPRRVHPETRKRAHIEERQRRAPLQFAQRISPPVPARDRLRGARTPRDRR